MGSIVIFDNPVIITLNHDDVVQEIYTDPIWGTDHDVYLINNIQLEELVGKRWTIYVIHPGSGKEIQYIIEPYEISSKNLPTPIRFYSYPLNFSLSFVGVL